MGPIVNETTDKPAKTRPKAAWMIVLVVVAVFAIRSLSRAPAGDPVVCDTELVPDTNTVVMLSASWCGYCRQARAYLQSNDINHCEYDVETTAKGRQKYAALPVQLVPVIRIKDEVLYGFSRDEVEQTLMAAGLLPFD